MSCGAANAPASGPSAASPASAQSSPVNPPLPIPYPTDVLTYHYNVYPAGLHLAGNHSEHSATSTRPPSEKLASIPWTARWTHSPSTSTSNIIDGSLNQHAVRRDRKRQHLRLRRRQRPPVLAEVSALGQGETPSDDHGCGQISPQIGITDTPVIDKGSGPNGAIYFVAMTKDSSGNYHQRLHALDLTTGGELFGGPTEIASHLSRHRRRQPERPGHFCSRTIRRARWSAGIWRHDLHRVHLALR